MKLVIFWEDYLHYHVARVTALHKVAVAAGDQIHAIALRARSPELPFEGYHDQLTVPIKVLSSDSSNAGGNSVISQKQLLTELDKVQPDAVAIIGYRNRVSRAALGWCRYHRRGAIVMFESQAKDFPRSPIQELLKGRLVRLYDAAIVGGSTHADYVKSLGMPPERVFTKYDVVNNQFWAQNAALAQSNPHVWQKTYNLPEKYFLSVSRFIPKKNLAHLVRAYADYVQHSEAEPWSLVVAGDGEEASNLRQLVAQLGLTDLVYFLGYLRAEEMAGIYGLASVFILASKHAEQWGLVVNEAMAAGLPVLVSNICGSAPELVLDGITGFRFDPENKEQLTKLLLKISLDKSFLEQMGKEGQRHIQAYSPESFAHNLLKAAGAACKHADTRRWPIWPVPQLWRYI